MSGLNTTKLKLIGIVCLATLIAVLFSSESEAMFSVTFAISFLICVIITSVLWVGNSCIFYYLHKKMPGIEQTALRGLLIALFCLVYTIVAHSGISVCLHHSKFGTINWPLFWLDLKISLLFTSLMVLLHETIYFFDQWKETYLNAEKLKKENVQAQLDSLRNQVNPHFLFNSLNTLISIIPECPETAVDFTQKLSNVYRYLLNVRDKELVALTTEMDFIRSYLFLLSVRFGENLKIEIQIADDMLFHMLPPVSIQMLLENAIKHNIVSREKPLHITIYTENNLVIVKNNLQPKQQKEESTGIGLENIRKRYDILSSRNMEVTSSATHFTVSLPLLEIN